MISLSAALLASLLVPGRASADADAVIQDLSGPVQVRPYGEKKFIEGHAGFPLAFKDELRTGPKGIVHVAFPNEALVLVKENARFTIDGSPKRTRVSVAVGEFLVGLKRSLGLGESFVVRTPSAVAAVRGTLFWGLSDAKKDSAWAGFGHKVAVTAQNKTVVLEPGQSVRVVLGQPPSAVETATPPKAFLATFSIKDGIGGLDRLVDPSLK